MTKDRLIVLALVSLFVILAGIAILDPNKVSTTPVGGELPENAYGFCYFVAEDAIDVLTSDDCQAQGGDAWNGPNIAHPVPENPAVAKPSHEPTIRAAQSPGYANAPFGNWSEPGYCLENGKKVFDVYDFDQSIDCFEKVSNPEMCDYTNECFKDQKSWIKYLKIIGNV